MSWNDAHPRGLHCMLIALVGGLLSLPGAVLAVAETCLTATEMDAANRSALESSAKRYFQFAAAGDTTSLRQNSVASLANDFGGIEAAVNDNKAKFSGAQSTVRPPYLLQAPGNAPIARAEFYCGIYNSGDRVGFAIPNLPPGNYGVVIQDVNGPSGPYSVSMVLQQQGSAWKLAGFYVRPQTLGGHDFQWFWDKARESKAKGQLHNAYFYYLEARQLMSPVDFMGTPQLDKIYDETQQSVPKDLPVNGPVNASFGGTTYKLIQVFPVAVNNDFDLVVKYEVPDISDTSKTFQSNMAVIKGFVAAHPEVREAFAGVVARAVTPTGQDYGSMLPMKEIK